MASKLPPDVSSLDIDICDVCNFSCIYCYHHDMNGHRMPEKTIDTIVEAIPKTEKPFNINFFGGEPLLALDRIKYFIRKCEENDLNMKYGLTSNLSMLNDDIVAYMRYKKISIHCSIDGNPEIQDTQRPKHGGQPTSHIIESKVKYALKITPNDTVRMTILKKNLPHYYDSVKYMFNTLGFASCAPVLVAEENWSKEDWDVLDEQLRKTVDWVYTGLVRHKRWHNVKWIEKAKPASLKRSTQMCGAGLNNIAISLSGDMYPCHRFTRADNTGMYWLGNIHDKNWLVDFLSRRILINSLHDNNFEMCLHCPAFETCGGGCPHINVTSSGKGTEEKEQHKYLPPYNYCEIKRRQHHWGTYFWRKIYQYKLNNERLKKLKVAPSQKPSQVTDKQKTSNYRDNFKGAEAYNEFYSEQKSARELLIAKFGKKNQKEQDVISKEVFQEEEGDCSTCSC